MQNLEMVTLMQLIAEYHDEDLSQSRAQMYASDLEAYSPAEINQAWKTYRMALGNNKMPKPFQLIQFVQDGHPTAQESWAMIPRDESASVIWSDEMRAAYSIAEPLIREGNVSGAFFAYREEYEKQINQARALRKKPRWSPSFGDYKPGRDAALITAIERGRITPEKAVSLYPELEYNQQYEVLALGYEKKSSQLEIANKEKLKQLMTLKRM